MADQALARLVLTLARAVEVPFKPLWSKRTLKDIYQIQTGNLGWEPRRARAFRAALSDQFPASRISGYERYLPQCHNGEAGRHVLACALAARADKIVTYNLHNFCAEQLAPWRGRVLHPDDYLLELYHLFPECVLRELCALAQNASETLGSKVTIEHELAALAPYIPDFARTLIAAVRGDDICPSSEQLAG
ncbi:hypothetical protein AXK11_07215 [Cephaloticoccus primus]|uniref:PIN domain-containing protein n=1 Tax=Cephaloticoccus primus TaxID=1548207 RepID=A0A139SKQ8_9BACT|nr:hypothetical protein AXK11_07215 [Cephaloticoccus primus]